MDRLEALDWINGERSMINLVPQEPFETWQVRIAEADAAMVKQAYYILKAQALLRAEAREEQMGKVQRYDMKIIEEYEHLNTIEPDNDGDFVLYDDYRALEAERDELLEYKKFVQSVTYAEHQALQRKLAALVEAAENVKYLDCYCEANAKKCFNCELTDKIQAALDAVREG